MGIGFALDSLGKLMPTQSFHSPSVYLDHWALKEIAETEELQSKFIRLIKSKNGVLLLNHQNFVEYCGTADSNQCNLAIEMLNKLFPNIFLAKFDLRTAATEIRNEGHSVVSIQPISDQDFLDLITSRARNGKFFDELFSEIRLFRNEISDQLHQMSDSLLPLMAQLRSDPTFLNKAKRYVPTSDQPMDAIALAEILRPIFLDASQPIDGHDVSDLIHALSSLAYCDFVLLDKKWVHYAGIMQHRIDSSSVAYKRPLIYSKKNNGINSFLNELEKWKEDSHQ